MVVIYKIISPSGRIYIGQTRKFSKRMTGYKNGWCARQRKLCNSLMKYGFDNHKIIILHKFNFDVSQSMLDGYEIVEINLHKALGFNMLNIRNGGHRGLNSPESKKLMSEKAKLRPKKFGRRHTEESKIKMRNWHTGKILSAEHKNKISQTLKINPSRPSPEGRLRTIAAHLKPIYQFDMVGNFKREWNSISICATELKLQQAAISRVCMGALKSTGGFVFKYKNAA